MSKETDVENSLWVAIGATLNTGNYESIRVDAGARRVVQDVDDPEEWEKLWNLVDEQISAQISEAKEDLEKAK